MRISILLAAAGLAAGTLAPTAGAQTVTRTTTTTTTSRTGYGLHRPHRVCRTTYHHHRRVTRCFRR